LHIVKLLDRKGQVIEVLQSNVRHILLEADSEIAIKQASKKLLKIKARLESGEDFAELARIYSEDSVSAADGGSLEWVNPGASSYSIWCSLDSSARKKKSECY